MCIISSLAGSLSLLLALAWLSVAPNERLKKPSVELQASTKLITYPCPSDWHSMSRSCPTAIDPRVVLTATAKGLNRQLKYVYAVSGGRIVGEGSTVTWDLSEFAPGKYYATVEVQDDRKHQAAATVSVTVATCGDCVISDFPCPQVVVTCYDRVNAGTPITCKVFVGASTRPPPTIFEWSTRDWNGEDLNGRISGQGKSISIRTDGLGGRHLNTKVEVKKLDPSCSGTATASTEIRP